MVSATGGASGGQVTITGATYRLTNQDATGSMSSTGPIDFAGTFALNCTATYCRIPGTIYEIRAQGGALDIVNSGMLTPYRGTTMLCSMPPLPGIAVVTVDSLATVQGIQVPAVVRWTGGHSGGAGDNCSHFAYQLAWDLVGTRQP